MVGGIHHDREERIRELAEFLLVGHAIAGNAPGGEFVFEQAAQFVEVAERRQAVAEQQDKDWLSPPEPGA